MGNIKVLSSKVNTNVLGFGVLVNAPLVLPLLSNLVPIKGFSPVNEFDGVDDYVETVEGVTDNLDEVVIETKFKTTSTIFTQLLGSYGTGGDGCQIYMNNSGTIQFQIRDSNGSYKTTSASLLTYNDNQEYTAKLVYIRNETLKGYIDDVEVGTINVDDFATRDNTIFRIGKRRLADTPFEGNIDYVKIWNDTTQTNLIASYDLKNNASYGLNQVPDLSGNGNHGTSYGKGEFSRSTDGTCIDYQGVIQTIPIDIARFEGANWDSVNKVFSEYDDSGNRISSDTLKGLMSYEGATNLLTYSEDFSNSAWVKNSNSTITSNQAISPDGTLTADLIDLSAQSDSRVFNQYVSISDGIFTSSIYVKSVSGSGKFPLRIRNTTQDTNVDLLAEINDTEWKRFDIQLDGVLNGDTVTVYGGTRQVSGEDLNIAYIWGAQLNTSSFPMPYIKTDGSTASTTADIHKQDVTDIIQQGFGSLYCEFNCDGINDGKFPYVLELSDGSVADNRIGIYLRYDNNLLRADCLNATVSQGSISTGDDIGFNIKHKVLVTYKDDEMKLFFNGSKIGEITSCTIPTNFTTIRVGNTRQGTNQLNGTVRNVKYYNEVLSEAQAINMTK